MIITSNVDNQAIELKLEPHTHYGILVSGGLDSATLLYWAAWVSQDLEGVTFQPFTVKANDECLAFTQNVIDWVNARLGTNIPPTIQVGSWDVHHSQRTTTGFRDIMANYPDVKFVLQGTNQNPPPPFDYLRYGGPENFPQRVKSSLHPRSVLPFIKLYKSHILDIMVQLGIMDLAAITHTCTEQPVGRCQYCFQDHERAWAFQQLNIQDPGIL